MVATDVASRGIGMIENPFPCKAMPSRLNCSALLSTLRRFLKCVTLLGLCRVLRFSIMENLGSVVQHLSCYTRNSVLRVSSGYGAELAFLDSSNLSPRLPSQRTRMWISRPSRGNALDSPCQMQREYWMHIYVQHHSPLEPLLYNLFALANHMKMFAT